MKKTLWSALAFLGLSFLLSGLQGSLYFSPIPLPASWFVILTYYSFRKSLIFALCLNFAHIFVLASFAQIPWAPMILAMNLLTIAFSLISERFHTQSLHIALGASGGFLLFQTIDWFIRMPLWRLEWPPLLTWAGTSLSTLVVAPVLIFTLDAMTRKIEYERIDTLENLRI
jgi:hypothetical protein